MKIWVCALIGAVAHATAAAAQGNDACAVASHLVVAEPALVVWQSGTVDALRGVDPDEFRVVLEEGIVALQAGGADVVLMNMQYSPRTESIIALGTYAETMRFVALEREVPLFDRFAI